MEILHHKAYNNYESFSLSVYLSSKEMCQKAAMASRNGLIITAIKLKK